MRVMNVVFVEPFFPSNQRQFARALAEAGATVIGIGEYGVESFDDDLKGWLHHYERVSSVTDADAMTRAVRWVQDKLWVDRLEATIEAHTMAAAQVREACTIPGTSVRTAWLCRDKPSMKEVLREAGVPTAASAAVSSAASARDFAERAGFPLILKPRSGAGASGTVRVDSVSELDAALGAFGGQGLESIAVEEFVEGHEGFYDTIAVDGRVALDFVSHYYPNVLEAMRTRWISPQFVSTNRVDTAPEYGELRSMGQRVITALGIGTSATHMEWFFGPKGLRFSEIGCRPTRSCAARSAGCPPGASPAGSWPCGRRRTVLFPATAGWTSCSSSTASGSSTRTCRRRARPPRGSRPGTWPTPTCG